MLGAGAAAALGAAVVLLCPVFLGVQVFLDAGAKKCYFSLYLFRVVKVYGGYATLYDRGIAFHLTRRKAVLLPYAEIVDTRKKFELWRGFRLLAYSQVIEAGRRSDPASALALCACVQAAASLAAGYLFTEKKCASFKADVLLYERESCLKASVRAVFVFCLAIVLLTAAKLVLRKIWEKHYERKQARRARS